MGEAVKPEVGLVLVLVEGAVLPGRSAAAVDAELLKMRSGLGAWQQF